MTTFLRQRLWPAIALLVAMTVVTGFLYPLVVTAVAQVAFPPGQRLVHRDRRRPDDRLEPHRPGLQRPEVLLGPALGRRRDRREPARLRRHRLGRLEPRTDEPGPDRAGSRQQVDALRAANGDKPIPVDLVTTSASGLDPDISPAAAEYQVARVATARGMSEDDVRAAVARHTEQPLLGFLGQARVNVLLLNLDLDGLLAHERRCARAPSRWRRYP